MNRLILDADLDAGTISRHLYGHFSEHLGRCIYGGYWVGEDSPTPNNRGIRRDVVEALRGLAIPNLRWPGGCFADEYHWMDGIGPREKRPSMLNTHWGGVTENNAFGTHEFLDLCEQLNCEPYICGNVGSGTVREMQQWVEYITFDGKSPMTDLRCENGRDKPWHLTYWGVGNENWGCGGRMRPEYYADEYKRYATYCRDFGGNQLFKIACGPNSFDYRWTEVLMREASSSMQGLALHYYCGSGKNSRSATQFGEEDWFEQLARALKMDELLRRHSTIMDSFDPEGRVALVVDEWGAWHDVEPGTNSGFLYQQNSLRDALVAGITLNIFQQHCKRVRMANIAQTVNVLQSMILTDEERMLLTPTYHVFQLYKGHQDATLLPAHLSSEGVATEDGEIPAINASASRSQDGSILITLCNLDPNQDRAMECELRGARAKKAKGRLLTADTITAHNTFETPENVMPVAFDDIGLKNGVLSLSLPGKSVLALKVQ